MSGGVRRGNIFSTFVVMEVANMKTPHTAKILAFTMLLSFFSNACYSFIFTFLFKPSVEAWYKKTETEKIRLPGAPGDTSTFTFTEDVCRPAARFFISAAPVVDVLLGATALTAIALKTNGTLNAHNSVNYNVVALENNTQGYKLAKCDCKYGENVTPVNAISMNQPAPQPNTTFSVLRAKNDHGATCTFTYASDKTKKEIALHVHQGWAEFGRGGQIHANWEDVDGIPDAGTITLTRGHWDWKDLKEISPIEAIKRIHNTTGSRPGLVEVTLNNNM